MQTFRGPSKNEKTKNIWKAFGAHHQKDKEFVNCMKGVTQIDATTRYPKKNYTS